MRRTLIILLLLALAGGVAAYFAHTRKQQELHAAVRRDAALKDNLFQMRKAIDHFRQAEGRYPHALQELVPKYIREIPKDPITNEANWRLTTEETVVPSNDFGQAPSEGAKSVILDVHSAAPGAGHDGVRYADY
jgi:general secretion pathway protein G